jgi:signal transduction histidine kinase
MQLRNAQLRRFAAQLEKEIAERRDAEAALRQSEKHLHNLSAQLLTVQEKERRRVSRELHEDLGQSLVVLKLQLRLLGNAIAEDKPAARAELRAASEQIDDLVRHIRSLSRDLSPSILEDLGFAVAARRLVANCAADSGLTSTVTIDADVDVQLQREQSTLMYRILEEALENIRNHAEATRLSVSIKQADREIWLTVEDDGKGIDCNRDEYGGLGLGTMHERARMLNGSLDIWSAPGQGTRITLKIPKEDRVSTAEV